MRSARKLFIVVSIITVTLAMPTASTAQKQQDDQLPRYAVTDLGTLGGTFSLGYAVNNKGWITGNSTLPGNTAQHVFFERHGVKTDVGTLGGITSATQGLNLSGQVVGAAENSLPDPMNENFCFFGTGLICLPFFWQNGAISALPTLGGTNGIAYGINNLGQAAGVAENATLDSTCSIPEYQSEPVIWNNGVVQALPTLAGDPDGLVIGINDHGQAVGGSGGCFTSSASSPHAVLWQNGVPTNLGNLGGTQFALGTGINDLGQVIGDSNRPGDTTPLFFLGPPNTHAFFWQNGTITDMGALPGDTASFAVGINNKGQAVGVGSRALLWQSGVLIDLNSLVPGPPFSPLFLLQAFGINDRGEITGEGVTSDGELHGFLAVPCDDNHANQAACNGSGVSRSADTSARSALTEASPLTAKTNPPLGVRFTGMRDGPPIQQVRPPLVRGNLLAK